MAKDADIETGKAYAEFLARQGSIRQLGQPTTPVVSTKSYDQATKVIADLKEAGVEANITEGGISVRIESEGNHTRATEILEQKGLDLEIGQTFAATFREALRSLRGGGN